ncbi:hypothetical protein K432DRAFT_415785 [Lepidopterella palustris CBS 459.81]|uniref:Uncharacterized protein n=1 Tax=Lepidopterella palustris CBS 459.81 TaxID=1314670 RepID=A0A8E2JGN2_9PEZI|nr:hypothetical protein K432DRAFT_415785 [Lepidopterella palustris CBS 459.81]
MGVDDTMTYGAQLNEASGQCEQSTKRKRKQHQSLTNDDNNDDEVVFLGTRNKSEIGASGFGGYDEFVDEEDQPKRVKKTRKSSGSGTTVEEKRLRKWRANPPRSYLEIRSRALTQRMFVIDRHRGGTVDVPEEIVEIAGTTGNIYNVTINHQPCCTCPYAKKGNQCKHIVYVLSRVLRAPEQLSYQLAFVSSELRDIFEKAPAIPSANSSDASSDGNRKTIEDDCPICCMEFEPDKEEIVYCKAACGNNIHKHCFDQWAVAKKNSSTVTCPFCRTPWAGDESDMKKIAKGGKVNSEGYVNVASELGLSGARDYSTYHSFWVRRQAREGLIDRSH